MRVGRTFICLTVFAVVSALVACGPKGSKVDAAADAEWSALTESKQNLDGLRQELADVRAAIKAASKVVETEGDAEEAGDEEVEGEEGDTTPAASKKELMAKASELEDQVLERSDEFGGRLVTFLNNDPMIEGEPPTERQLEAIRLKSSEDLVLAGEYIDKGGDYRRAIEIYEASMQLDPDNADLKAALADAEEKRYMSEERFEAIAKGMNQEEVRDALGQVNLRNIREYPERDVIAWFYATHEDGSAAAVWFKKSKDTELLEVYQVKYDAVKPGAAETEQAEQG